MTLFAACILAVFACPSDSLYEQSLSRLLERKFAEEDTAYLLLEVRTGRITAARWDAPEKAIPLGSLVKPFVALSYGATHGFRYPAYGCTGTSSGCWLGRGHGTVGIREAIAHSCNAYFRRLAAGVRAEDLAAVMRRFGVQGPTEDVGVDTMIGMGDGWNISPVALARAYCELASRSFEPGARELLSGMALSAMEGTGHKAGAALRGVSLLAKTGTAPCEHAHKKPGDGYVLVLFPAEQPRFALLVQKHGSPGMEAAAAAGRLVRLILQPNGSD
jgi:cell division protein FtsI/penicillin-binding protein 2